MARVMFINPSKWGRGITPIWIASHAAALRGAGHEVALFDATFFADWTEYENRYNTANRQYRPSPYEEMVRFGEIPVREALTEQIQQFSPDVIFFSALSSHIHGEGEYVAIQLGVRLLEDVGKPCVIVCGGLQSTADPVATGTRFPIIDYLITGESDLVLVDLVSAIDAGKDAAGLAGVVARGEDGAMQPGTRQPIIHDLDRIGPYDYSLFSDQVLLRPYNGEVVRAVDYELSRGCPFSCNYCVETVIQRYYGFTERSPRGALLRAREYLRAKSARRIFEELRMLHEDRGVTFIRCQDTNFLTIERRVLLELADLMAEARLPIKLYVETRPEGINARSVALLQSLNVDGVGMGIELATQSFREEELNRFSDQGAIERAFELLRVAGIRRTAYNIIGIPDQTEQSILETISFNRRLVPDNVTVAFYSPYLGTVEQEKGVDRDYFLDYEYDVDSQLRTMTRHSRLTPAVLNHYKREFVRLVRDHNAPLTPLASAAA